MGWGLRSSVWGIELRRNFFQHVGFVYKPPGRIRKSWEARRAACAVISGLSFAPLQFDLWRQITDCFSFWPYAVFSSFIIRCYL